MKKVDITDVYKTSAWLHLREEQLEADRYECQRCKHQGKYSNLPGLVKYTRATLVHHEYRVRKFPQYAYKRFVGSKRNLYSLCESCHEIEHKEERGFFRGKKKKPEFNQERW